jgi:ferredoxin
MALSNASMNASRTGNAELLAAMTAMPVSHGKRSTVKPVFQTRMGNIVLALRCSNCKRCVFSCPITLSPIGLVFADGVGPGNVIRLQSSLRNPLDVLLACENKTEYVAFLLKH